MAKFTEEEITLRRIEKRFNKGVVQYGLIEEGDKIIIGLSGGKDSLALIELLGKRAQIYKPRFSVMAVHSFQSTCTFSNCSIIRSSYSMVSSRRLRTSQACV